MSESTTCSVFRLAGAQLLFMGSMAAILVSEMHLKHNRVNLPEDAQQKRDVESVSGVFQVFFHRLGMQGVISNAIWLTCSVYIC